MIWFKKCPRCAGNLCQDDDLITPSIFCFQCGFRRYVESDLLESTPIAPKGGTGGLQDVGQITNLADIWDAQNSRRGAYTRQRCTKYGAGLSIRLGSGGPLSSRPGFRAGSKTA